MGKPKPAKKGNKSAPKKKFKKSGKPKKKNVNPKPVQEIEKKPEVVSKIKPEETNDTIFIRNLSFETEEDDLKKFIEDNFGETVYCLICRDKETDESKGTAFARFKDPQNAATCLQDFKDREKQFKFHLDGRNLIVLSAISRERVSEVKKKDDVKKDKRNLELAREGYIKPDSDEAKDVSKNDLEKRRILDSRKREKLKNLHNFVSDTRLCIHNLPANVDDKRLRQILLDAVNQIEYPGAKLVECKVMRNKKGSGQLGSSKGFGFFAFSKHEHAIAALRTLNNNPTTFSKDKRPIVEFSIENMVALNKKKTRIARSLSKTQDAKSKPTDKGENKGKKDEKSMKQLKKMKRRSTVNIKIVDSSQRLLQGN